MSSRAMRKLQRRQEQSADNLTLSDPKNSLPIQEPSVPVNPPEGEEEEASDDSTTENSVSEGAKRKKKNSKRAVLVNPFALLTEDLDDEVTNGFEKRHDSDDENGVMKEEKPTTTQKAGKKSKKSKKKNREKESRSEPSNERDLDPELAVLDAIVQDRMAQGAGLTLTSTTSQATEMSKPILAIEHRCLDPENEIRRIFGSSVVQQENGQRRQQRQRGQHRNMWLVNPRDNWPPARKTGLSMRLVESKNGLLYFSFVHSKFYQKIQFQFLDAVESFNPQNLVDLLNLFPFHIDTLLQVSEVFKINEDWQAASQMIERALHVFESSFHPSFSLTQGTCRLDYRYPENRSFYLALLHHLVFVGRRSCYRTALEFCKLIFSLDPDTDPLCMLLLIDFYALRSRQHAFLVRLASEWEAQRALSLLPNFAFSLPLALFHRAEGSDPGEADRLLQQALLMFPSVLTPLLDKCGVTPDPRVTKHAFFGPSALLNCPDGLTRLVQLYVGRTYFCWKEAGVLPWLERNVSAVLDRVDQGEPLVELYGQKRALRYRGTPLNIYRHIVLSDIKEATAHLAYEVTNSPVLSYDPLPPQDPIISYSRPPRRRVVEEPGNPLSMFLRSLVPTFNPQELVPERGGEGPGGEGGGEEGAVGGQLLAEGTQSINAVMVAMRAMLNRIQFLAPPGGGADPAGGGVGGDAAGEHPPHGDDFSDEENEEDD